MALVFNRIPGKDFKESNSPVINEVTMRLMILYYIMNKKMVIRQLDVEAAFLEGKLKEEIYIRKPEGLGEIDDCDWLYGRLNKSLYGLVQESYVFYNELRSYMIDTMDIIQCQSDTCFFRDVNNELFIGVYVDDILVVGSE